MSARGCWPRPEQEELACPGSGPDTQRARLFDTRIASPLHNLPPSIDQMRRSLALLNIKRGVALELPSQLPQPASV